MELSELIRKLLELDQDKTVLNGFGSPHSDRGSYEDLAFEPVEKTTIGEMVAHAKSALNKDFFGYKGGTYKMREWTNVLIGNWGDCGDEITDANFLVWNSKEFEYKELAEKYLAKLTKAIEALELAVLITESHPRWKEIGETLEELKR